jgi:hypothetical protein
MIVIDVLQDNHMQAYEKRKEERIVDLFPHMSRLLFLYFEAV